MYEAFYGLNEKPFNLTPDPRFLYLSSKHKEAFAHLLYGIRNRCGFVMVSGEIGTGKTTICRSLLKQLDPDTEVAFIFNPKLSPIELLQTINADFGIASKAETVRGLIDELNAHLLDRASKGKNCVLIIDEAQNLGTDTLEQIRLLSNLETETEKLLQIVLIGQPELAAKLELVELRQLNQRITARYHLGTLSGEETLHYIAFRLRVAGGRKKVKFARSAVRTIHRISGGTPRVINALCDRALLIGYTQETRNIASSIVRKAASEIQGAGRPGHRYGRFRRVMPASLMAATAVLALAAVLWWPTISNSDFTMPTWLTAQASPDETSDAIPLAITALANETVVPAEASALPPIPAPQPPSPTPNPGVVEAAIVTPADSTALVSTESLAPPAATSPQPLDTKTSAPEVVPPSDNAPPAEQNSSSETASASAPAESQKTDAHATEQVASLPAPPKPEVPREQPIAEPASEPVAPPVSEPEPEPAPAPVVSAKPHEGLSAIVRSWKLAVLQPPPASVTWSTIVKFATSNGLRALSMKPNTTQIATIDLPVLVRLRDGKAEKWAAVTSLESDNIRVLRDNGEEEDFKPDAFRKAYTGDAFYLWNDPDPKAEPLRPSTESEAVSDLQADLRTLGLLDREPTGTYDDATIEAVGRIQRATGIAVDGVAGPQTRMVLISWLDRAGAPNLSSGGFSDSLRARVLALPGMITPSAPGELESIPLPEKLPVAAESNANEAVEKAGP